MEHFRFSKIIFSILGIFCICALFIGVKYYRIITIQIHRASSIKVTLREGLTNEEMATVLAKSVPDFNSSVFLVKTKNRQGYLFPDTYFFTASTSADDVNGVMHMNFNKKVLPLIKDNERSVSDIIIMASIIEKEASGKSDAGVIAGILWKRISLGMPLQVDASVGTYTTKGLPGAPISNPGLVSITAALHPVYSPYLYYLHDKNGMVHYAETFAEHKKNIATYLK